MEKFQQLKVWQKAHAMTLGVYKATRGFPETERYGLVSQLRRAAVSVVANIVEGTKRRTIADRKHFHVMADGSLEEVKCLLLLAQDLNYIEPRQVNELLEATREVGAMLHALTAALSPKL